MVTQTYVYSTVLTMLSCHCGIPFAIPENLYTARRNDGGRFYCPQGHVCTYHESENDRLTRLLNQERDRVAAARARADGAEASLRTTKGHVTRLRKQVLAGECPLCGQHLRDLARHISRQHPTESPEPE